MSVRVVVQKNVIGLTVAGPSKVISVAKGPRGVGVPSGGTTGQVLAKINGTDYNTQWIDQGSVYSTTYHLVSAPTTNASIVKPSAGTVVGWSITNTNASFRYVKLHNTAGTPTAGSGVVQTIGVPPNGVNNQPLGFSGVSFTTGIAFTTVTGSADADATAVGAGDLIIDLFYA